MLKNNCLLYSYFYNLLKEKVKNSIVNLMN